MEHRNDDVNYPTISSWVRGKCIGRGCFGTVSLAVEKSGGRIFAAKSVDLATCLPVQLQSLENEIRILRSVSSPHIVGFLGDDVTREGTTSFRNLRLEYLPRGTVADVAGYDLDERLVRRFTWCLVSALKHMHSRGLAHCDVKGRNILVGPGSSSVKLADFGSAMEIRDSCAAQIMPRGSPLWMAPEVIRREYQGPESDVWSLGCTVIEMVAGKPAWCDGDAKTVMRIGFSDELPPFPTRLSELGRDFLKKCLRREPSERWSCDQLLKHPFLSSPDYTDDSEPSPRCVLDWVNSDLEEEGEENESESAKGSNSNLELSARVRIGKIATNTGAIWETDGWYAVRGSNFEEGERKASEMAGTSSVYSDLARQTKRTNWEFCDLQWQCCKSVEFGMGERGPTGGGGGSSCRYRPMKVGSAVERRMVVSCKLFFFFCLRIFIYILLLSKLFLYNNIPNLYSLFLLSFFGHKFRI